MSGITYVEKAVAVATTGHMLVTFTSGGEEYRFHIPANVALAFRQAVLTDTCQVCCAPDADVVTLRPGNSKGAVR